MSSTDAHFDSDWLALRERADATARSRHFQQRLAEHLTAGGTVLEFAGGTGSLLRALVPRLTGEISWRLLDHDVALLQRARDTLFAWASAAGYRARHVGPALELKTPDATLRITFEQHDLTRLPTTFYGDAIVASAWCDLVSADWIENFAQWCRRWRVPMVYLAMTVDGSIDFSPSDELDEAVSSAFQAHMQKDKGFGPAIGGDGHRLLSRALNECGYRIASESTPWQLDGMGNRLLAEWVCGVAAAAAEQETAHASGIAEHWLPLRLQEAAAGRLRVRVGHFDLLALRRPDDP